MTQLSDAAVNRLKRAASWPAFASDRYAVSAEIGRGGMGTVYLAVDDLLGREVAIKVPNAVAPPDAERRLHLETRALARLEHPGIVPIHDCGRLADGRLFYVMKHVKGSTLREHLATVPELSDRLTIFQRLCDPVAFAHAQGIIHRDLKPDNVMIGSFGEVIVMDWGVARITRTNGAEPIAEPSAEGRTPSQSPVLNSGASTRSGTVIGTRGFMPPEQARGAIDDVTERADVYSLGAILFMMLTDREPPPAHAADVIAHYASVSRPLRAICARAMREDPAARYPAVEALADEIARYRGGRAVEAHEENIIERARRVGRTYRTAILLVVAYVVMRAVVAFTTGW